MDDTTEPPSEHTALSMNLQAKKLRVTKYQSAVGFLKYLTLGTRPDIAYAVSILGRNASNPTSTPQTSPMDPQPFGPREPQPYRVVPRPPTPPPRDDDLPLQASHYLTLEEEMRMGMGRLRERNGRVNDPPSTSQHDSGYRNRAATGPGTSEDSNDAQNQPQDPHDRIPASGREPQRPGLSKPALVALGLAGSAVMGGLGWKFWHSRVAGELFVEAVEGSEALMVVGKGLMGVSAAVARGVWAVARHAWRHRRAYEACGLVYGLWFKGEILGHWLVATTLLVITSTSEPCYCYACRVEMALAIKRETGVSLAEIYAPSVETGTGDDRKIVDSVVLTEGENETETT